MNCRSREHLASFRIRGGDSSFRGVLPCLVQSHEIQISVFTGRREGERFRSNNEVKEDTFFSSKEVA